MRWLWGRRAPDVLKDGQQSPRGVERPAPYTALPLPPPAVQLGPEPQPGCDQEKLRITKVGVMRLTPQGQIYTQGWQFSSFIRWAPSGQYDTSVALDGKMAGWHMRELHAIAHGSPCDCGVTELVEREFPHE